MAIRKPLVLTQDIGGQNWSVRFRHPIRGIVRIPLGWSQDDAKAKLGFFNLIFLNPDNWHNRPATVPVDVWNLWVGESAVETDAKPTELELTSTLTQVKFWRDQYFRLQSKWSCRRNLDGL